MNTDRAFQIGSTHSVCEDYVVARNGSDIAGGPYVILSDGCSSSPDTDIGARLLVKAAEKLFIEQGSDDAEVLHNKAARLALDWAALMGLPAQSIDATLMSAQVTGEHLIIACSGDGVVLLESQTGTLDLFVISSPSGYPFYPCYAHQPERLAELVAKGRTTKEIKHVERGVTISDSLTEVFRFNARDYKYAAVASDGIDSFFQTQRSAVGKRVENISLLDVLTQFWSFKKSHCAFVERRLNRFTKDAYANGWQHRDDLSIGVINLGGEHVRTR